MKLLVVIRSYVNFSTHCFALSVMYIVIIIQNVSTNMPIFLVVALKV